MTLNASLQSNITSRLLPDLLIFLKDVLDNETLSENAAIKCEGFIKEIEDVVKLPYLSNKAKDDINKVTNNDNNQAANDQTLDVTSLEFLHEQRELARQGTIWRDQDHRPKVKHDIKKSEKVNESIYERIGSIGNGTEVSAKEDKNGNNDNMDAAGDPPPVPERKGRTSSMISPKSPLQQRSCTSKIEVVLVHDLKTPLYSGLLRNVKENIKQWCVIKKQKLYLFNDLTAPADFIADLQEFEVFKEMDDMNVFRISRIGEPSLVLAAVDDEQYELWHYAFRRAKVLADMMDGRDADEVDLREYLSIHGSEDIEESSYETPENIMENEKHGSLPLGEYVPMGNLVNKNGNSIAPLSPINYEVMDMQPHQLTTNATNTFDTCDYSSMPLPPLPTVPSLPGNESPPELPARKRLQTNLDNNHVKDDHSSLSGSGSFEKLDDLDNYEAKQTNTLQKKIKGRSEKEIEFFHDISAVFCGTLHQRRMLAVWQKRFCKVKDQALLCYRSADAAEPVLRLELPNYLIDRADEAWKSHAFKMLNDSNDVFYFAAETRHDLVKWLNILVKETQKVKSLKKNSYDLTDSAPSTRKVSRESVSSSRDDLPEIDTGASSDFDADNESVDSANEELPPIITKNKFLRVNGKKNRRRADTMKDPNADFQGYLYRKLNNHWSKRWCAIKDEKFLSYKRTLKDPPDFIVLLAFASLVVLKSDGDEKNKDFIKSSNDYFFKLRYEGDISIVFRVRRKDQWQDWIECISKYIGSKSEEDFQYINVPPVDSELNNQINESFPNYESHDGYSFIPDNLSAKKSFRRDPSFKLPPRVPITANYKEEPPVRHPNELKQCYHSSSLTELQFYNQSFRHIERFAILTKDKWFKLYQDAASQAPVAWFSGFDISVVEEVGADTSILRLLVQLSGTELVFKADETECLAWKKAFNVLHYEEIDDVPAAQKQQQQQQQEKVEVQGKEKIFRARSKSIERKDKTEPVLLSHSKTLPHMGKLKKIAREARKEKDKARTLPSEPSPVPTSSRKSFSALIRSFTVDTISRKAKNKSYELSKDDNPTAIKETQHGFIDELIIDESGNHLLVERYCRISGKVFYSFENENDKKPIIKIPLRNAAIEDYVELENHLYQFKITEMDTGKEFMFSLNNEDELDLWMGAFFGEDQLHKSFENSPNSSSNNLYPESNISPRSNRASSLIEVGSYTQPSKSPTALTQALAPINIMLAGHSSVSETSTPDEQRHVASPPIDQTIGSSSSLQSTSRSTISETDAPLSPTSAILKSIDGKVIAKNYMLEYHESAKTKSRRWVVLKNDFLLVYRNDSETTPLNTLDLSEYTLASNDNKTPCSIKLKHKLGGITQYNLPTEKIYKVWLEEIKRILKKKTSISKAPAHLRNKNSLIDRLKLSEKDKRASLVLIADDFKAIEEYEKTADPGKTMTGILYEYFDEMKLKERLCWIKSGFLYIAKPSKADKVVKTIDLSTVVIFDESDASANKFCFKLQYLMNKKPMSVLLRAESEQVADRWMVAVSMGILFHRFSANNNRNSSDRESKGEDDETSLLNDFDFVKLGEDTPEDLLRKTRRDSREQKLGYDIKKAINLKAQHGEMHLKSVSEDLNNEFPSPNSSPLGSRKSNSNDLPDGGENESNKALAVPVIDDLRKSLSLINDDDDKVFNDTIETTNDELLENIPERENADETFKNIKGILRQQESIRRAILKRQRVDDGNDDVSTEKKIPPLIKPKPKLSKPLSVKVQQRFIVLKTNLEQLSMSDLHSYKEQLEGEKAAIVRSIKKMNVVVSEARTNLKRSLSMRENSSSSEKELTVVTTDLQTLQKRFQRLEKESKVIGTHINRKVALDLKSRRKSNALSFTSSTSLLDRIDSDDDVRLLKSPHLHEEGYNSEPILDDTQSKHNYGRDSIIV